ncbi:hypothetical protein IQ266_25160 [filamentous cyanobacterium LEGE 11480]|uniref:Uncharacterized protein n=1 Tax=Romeriopsis navalis LEGE 11480 TaxID=2777977 RepID=A0A928VR81_9CYAN|nr:hypothetical protein [Romeriopsis navalis]MBE9033030.1 hypothetical protein [Romeriopsis navalis LEGE 11480]
MTIAMNMGGQSGADSAVMVARPGGLTQPQQEILLQLVMQELRRTGRYEVLPQLVRLAEITAAIEAGDTGAQLLPETRDHLCDLVQGRTDAIAEGVQQLQGQFAVLEFWVTNAQAVEPTVELQACGEQMGVIMQALLLAIEQLLDLAERYSVLSQPWYRRVWRDWRGQSADMQQELLVWYCAGIRYSGQYLAQHVQVDRICQEWGGAAMWGVYYRRINGYLTELPGLTREVGTLLQRRLEARVPETEALLRRVR